MNSVIVVLSKTREGLNAALCRDDYVILDDTIQYFDEVASNADAAFFNVATLSVGDALGGGYIALAVKQS